MKLAKILAIVFICATLMKWIQGDQNLTFRDVFPFIYGHPFGVYDAAALALLVMSLRALRVLLRRGKSRD